VIEMATAPKKPVKGNGPNEKGGGKMKPLKGK